VRDALSQLQMAYAQLVSQPAPTAGNEGESGAGPQKPASEAAPEAASSPADDAERAKARSKIWTPPGS
jgi:hypothetical protein